MKKYLIALLVSALVVCPAFANEQTEEDYDEVELNAFGYPDKSFVKLIEHGEKKSSVPVKEKPACNDKKLAETARKITEPYINSPTSTIFNKRRNILITKNINNFVDLSIDKVPSMDNRVIKARITELKINNRLVNDNFKLCQSENPILKDKLFILMYDDNNSIKAEILNLAIEEIPSFYYK